MKSARLTEGSVELERREDGYWYRTATGHLAGPYSTKKRAAGEGALALAHALFPHAAPRDLPSLAQDLLTQDASRAYVRKFADGWRVWHPGRRSFVGGREGAFATAAEADLRRREITGESDGALFARVAPAASREPEQPSLFGPRRNPGEGRARASQAVPAAVRANLRRGLALVAEGRAGRGLRGQTVREAESMAAGDPVPADKVRRMAAWFRRHQVDRRPGWEVRRTPGFVAWLLWGGDEGWAWAERERAALVRRGVLPPLKALPRGNPGIFAPLRNGQGEAVTYRPEGEGLVVVRFSTPGVGAADREMDYESAVAHRAKLLRMGYRPNP